MANNSSQQPPAAPKPSAPSPAPAAPTPAAPPGAPAPSAAKLAPKSVTVFVEAVRVGIWQDARKRVGKRFHITVDVDATTGKPKLPSWVKRVSAAEAAAPDPSPAATPGDGAVL